MMILMLKSLGVKSTKLSSGNTCISSRFSTRTAQLDPSSSSNTSQHFVSWDKHDFLFRVYVPCNWSEAQYLEGNSALIYFQSPDGSQSINIGVYSLGQNMLNRLAEVLWWLLWWYTYRSNLLHQSHHASRRYGLEVIDWAHWSAGTACRLPPFFFFNHLIWPSSVWLARCNSLPVRKVVHLITRHKSWSWDSNEFLSKSRRARYDITPK